MLPFVGVDGEGGDIPDGDGFVRHRYTLLRAGEQTLQVPDGITDDPKLWVRWLSGLQKRRLYVAFAFDYDVTMMLKDAPEHVQLDLVNHGEARWDEFTLFYRPHKEFSVRRKGAQITINDVFTFFQCSFVEALTRWDIGTAEHREAIRQTKDERSHFGLLTEDVVDYNAEECRYLVEMMDKFRNSCIAVGYIPRRWQGAGQLSKAMYRAWGIPETKTLPEMPLGLWDAAQAAYYGGRFETSAVGGINHPCDGWDINSAYPYASTELPCLVHGRWERTREITPLSLLKIRWDHPNPSTFYSMPVRQKDGSIRYPRQGGGWYWGHEILAAQETMLADITVYGGWRYVKQCDCRWFDSMPRVYSVRVAMGKNGAGMVLKLGANGCYGVCAQSVGRAEYANPIWAGLFTAITRATIIRAVAQAPADVYMIATDGIYVKAGSIVLPESGALGGWSRKQYTDMWIVQPGLYFASGEEEETRHTRGIPLSAVKRKETELKAAWRGSATDGYEFHLRQFVALRLGVARGAYHQIGEWLPVDKTIRYDWSTKRKPDVLRLDKDGVYRTLPYAGDPDGWSVAYDRAIGGLVKRDSDRLEWADMPDWAESLTP